MVLRRIGLLTLFLLTACSSSPSTPQSTDPSPAPVFTAIPTLTLIPPAQDNRSPTNTVAGVTVYDFVDQMCNAEWMNGGRHFKDCPTKVASDRVTDGYVNQLGLLTLNLRAGEKVLVTYPAQNEYSACQYSTLTLL